MDRTEAKDILKYDIRQYIKQCQDATDEDFEALDLAIEALKKLQLTPTISEDCISRQQAIEELETHLDEVDEVWDEFLDGENSGIHMAIRVVESLPPVEPKRPKGEWIEHKYAEEYDGLMQSNFECSKCHDWLREQTNYCPICGARMNKGGDDNG